MRTHSQVAGCRLSGPSEHVYTLGLKFHVDALLTFVQAILSTAFQRSICLAGRSHAYNYAGLTSTSPRHLLDRISCACGPPLFSPSRDQHFQTDEYYTALIPGTPGLPAQPDPR